jgi:hypothetical protein
LALLHYSLLLQDALPIHLAKVSLVLPRMMPKIAEYIEHFR